jgi:tetratricopeptide (TPR) repeat protein
LRSQASEFLEEAATRGHDVQRSYAVAAFEAAASENAERATYLLDRAQQLGRAEFVDRVGAAIANDHTAVLSVGDPDIEDSLEVNLVAYALRGAERLEESIALLKRALDADSERTSSAVLLGRALLERSATPATTSRTMDRREALQLAVAARDQRRRWGGDSVEQSSWPVRRHCCSENSSVWSR